MPGFRDLLVSGARTARVPATAVPSVLVPAIALLLVAPSAVTVLAGPVQANPAVAVQVVADPVLTDRPQHVQRRAVHVRAARSGPPWSGPPAAIASASRSRVPATSGGGRVPSRRSVTTASDTRELALSNAIRCIVRRLVNLHAAAGTRNPVGNLTNARFGHVPVVITSDQQARRYTELNESSRTWTRRRWPRRW